MSEQLEEPSLKVSSSTTLVSSSSATAQQQIARLVRVPVPGDGSCLYSTLSLILRNHTGEKLSSQQLRERIAQEVDNHPEEYRDLLEYPEYANRIRDPLLWGGQTEIDLFTRIFGIGVRNINSETNTIYDNRARVRYSDDQQIEKTIFSVNDDRNDLIHDLLQRERKQETMYETVENDSTKSPQFSPSRPNRKMFSYIDIQRWSDDIFNNLMQHDEAKKTLRKVKANLTFVLKSIHIKVIKKGEGDRLDLRYNSTKLMALLIGWTKTLIQHHNQEVAKIADERKMATNEKRRKRAEELPYSKATYIVISDSPQPIVISPWIDISRKVLHDIYKILEKDAVFLLADYFDMHLWKSYTNDQKTNRHDEYWSLFYKAAEVLLKRFPHRIYRTNRTKARLIDHLALAYATIIATASLRLYQSGRRFDRSAEDDDNRHMEAIAHLVVLATTI
ncbi:unnamed protein product, partial [Didymodactylos carnosus]